MLCKVIHLDTERSWRGGERQLDFIFKFSDRKRFKHYLACRRGSILEKKAMEASIEVFYIEPFFAYSPLCAFKLRRFADLVKADILHAHTANAASLGALALMGSKIKFVAHRRVDFHLHSGFLSRWKYKRADKIIAVSNAIKKIMLQDGIAQNKVAVVHSGIDTAQCDKAEILDLRARWNLDNETVIIGMVNALAPHKGIPYFLEAVKIILARGFKVMCYIVGSGGLEARLKQQTVLLGIGDSVVFTGFVENPLDWIKSFDIFVISSVTEGLGSTVLDALALGKPVVATNSGGIPEMINSGHNGLLVEPANPAAIADAVESIISDEKLGKLLSHNAVKSIEGFSAAGTVKKIESIYEEILL